MNDQSSRSHALLIMQVGWPPSGNIHCPPSDITRLACGSSPRLISPPVSQVSWAQEKTKTFASLNLVDLAGSEGMKKVPEHRPIRTLKTGYLTFNKITPTLNTRPLISNIRTLAFNSRALTASGRCSSRCPSSARLCGFIVQAWLSTNNLFYRRKSASQLT